MDSGVIKTGCLLWPWTFKTTFLLMERTLIFSKYHTILILDIQTILKMSKIYTHTCVLNATYVWCKFFFVYNSSELTLMAALKKCNCLCTPYLRIKLQIILINISTLTVIISLTTNPLMISTNEERPNKTRKIKTNARC